MEVSSGSMLKFIKLGSEKGKLLVEKLQSGSRVILSWRQNVGYINGMYMGFILGGFGTYMTPEVFWICWTLVVTEAILFYTLQLRPEKTRPGRLQHQDWLAFGLVFVFKVALIIALEQLLTYPHIRPSTKSSDCEVGSGCYSRLRESLWTMVALYCLEVFLTLPRLAASFGGLIFQNFTRGNQTGSLTLTLKLGYLNWLQRVLNGDRRAADFALAVKVYPDWLQRLLNIYRRAAGRGALPLNDTHSILSWSFKSDNSWWDSEEWDFMRWNATKSSFVSSSMSVGLVVTVGSLVGGSFGTFMTAKAFWLCWGSVSIELISECILQSDSPAIEEDSQENAEVGKNQITEHWRRTNALIMVTWAVRFLGQGPVFALMVDMIRKNGYFATDMTNCDATCRARGRELIYVCCVATGFQCFGFLTCGITWYFFRLNYLVDFFQRLYVWVLAGVLVILPYLVYVSVVHVLLTTAGLVDRGFSQVFGRKARTIISRDQRTESSNESMCARETKWHFFLNLGMLGQIMLFESVPIKAETPIPVEIISVSNSTEELRLQLGPA